jgi:predicted AlkP superfamily pyrophosphatase or phosphodiesterase
MDIGPSVLSVLELPPLSEAQGQPRTTAKADRAVMIFVDGLQYEKLITLIEQNALPFFQSVEEIHTGLTVFPAITTSSSAALFTGLPPKDNGVYGYGYRSTERQTLFDIVTENGLKAIAVEGHGLAFSIRNAEVILSGDRDNNGYTSDNVLSNSLDVINTRMPDLLFIHFHDVDDMGHEYGPDSEQYETAIKTVDGYIAQIIDALPQGTFITIFADHGMQNEANGNGGNHGQLTDESMIIPIIFLEK